jgi:hypothetical protein
MLRLLIVPLPTVLLVQLPIPPLGPEPIRGNVPLAGAYLKLFAELRGLGKCFDIEILSAREANALGDRALVEAIVERRPCLLGFTCYLWNIERTLWIAACVRELLPETLILVGGPEVTRDNGWLLEHQAVDLAALGEGRQSTAADGMDAECTEAIATIARSIGVDMPQDPSLRPLSRNVLRTDEVHAALVAAYRAGQIASKGGAR